MTDTTRISKELVDRKLPHETEHLDALQRMKTLESYYRWTYKLFEKQLGNRVLDAGCGIGSFTALLEGRCQLVLAVDLSDENLNVIAQRFANSEVVKPMQLDLDNDAQQIAKYGIDSIVCLDVLEHVEDDAGLLRRFRQIVQPRGRLFLKVPACKWLYGSVDVASDHFRRYHRSELVSKVESSGWNVLSARYMNIFGVVPYFIKSRILQRQSNLSRTFQPWQLRLMQRVMPFLRCADRIVGPPIGQSLVVIAEADGD